MGKRRVRLGLAAAGITAALAIALAMPGRPEGIACAQPEIRVYKDEGTLELFCSGKLRRSMPATFGANPRGPKEREGDERTPEGSYTITSRVENDRFHRFLGVSYPNQADIARGHAAGVAKLGGGIGIHGTNRPVAARMWIRAAHATGLATRWGPTDGCVALTNEDVEVLAAAAPVGTLVRIQAHRSPEAASTPRRSTSP
jgi:murein L,D-transpeptidase YafK